MKKFLASFLTVLLLFACVSCGDNGDNGNPEDAYTSVCSQLKKTSMGGTEYSRFEEPPLLCRRAH